MDAAFEPFWVDARCLLDFLHGLILKPHHTYILTFLAVSLQRVSLKFCVCMNLTGREDYQGKNVLETCLPFFILFLDCFNLILISLIGVYGRCTGTANDAHDLPVPMAMFFTAR